MGYFRQQLTHPGGDHILATYQDFERVRARHDPAGGSCLRERKNNCVRLIDPKWEALSYAQIDKLIRNSSNWNSRLRIHMHHTSDYSIASEFSRLGSGNGELMSMAKLLQDFHKMEKMTKWTHDFHNLYLLHADDACPSIESSPNKENDQKLMILDVFVDN